jgi:RNA polymerase sigma-70 factor (ECF subfamily)
LIRGSLALERLSPLERAAFLLHDVFDLGFDEVAEALNRTTASCRQLASRARTQVRQSGPRFAVAPDEGERLTEAFFTASRSGDLDQLHSLLAESISFHSDGGGRKPAALRPIHGLDKVCRLFAGLAKKSQKKAPLWRKNLLINGLPGYATVEHDGTLQTTALEVKEERISAVYVMRNPEKLRHLLSVLPESIRHAVR